jgi:hypothetical protein
MRLIITPSGEVNTASNLGTGSGIFAAKVARDLRFKSLTAGAGILIQGSDTELSVLSVASGAGESNTASNLGAGEGVFSTKVGADLRFKSLIAGSNIALSSDSNEITIDASGVAGSGESNTASNVGAGTGVFKQKTGVDLEFKSLVGLSGVVLDSQTNEVNIGTPDLPILRTDFDNSSGIFRSDIDTNTTNITNLQTDFTNSSGTFRADIDQNASDITNIRTDFDNASGIWVKDAENIGDGSGLFVQKDSDANLEFKTLLPGANIVFTGTSSGITIASTASGAGGVDSASNLGAGEGIFAQKVGSDLQFKSLVAGSGIQISADSNEITIDNELSDDVSILRTDFDNSSGVFRSDIDTNTGNISLLQTDFTNSSGVFRSDIDSNTTNVTNIQTDFTNSSGIFQDGVDTADQVRVDFDNSSGVFRSDIDTNTTSVSNLTTDFVNSSGTFQTGVDTANQVRTDFDNASGIFVKDGSNLGTGSGVFVQKNASQELEFKTLVPGGGIQITGDSDELTITSVASGAGEANTGSNVGLGVGVFDGKSGVDLQFRSILGSSGIQVSLSGQTIRIDNALLDDHNILRNDFDNSSGVFRSDIDTNTTNITNLQTDFTNSSGVFQDGVNTANQVRTDFDNVSGVFRTDIDTNTSNISSLQTDFDNSSGVFVKTASNVGLGEGIFEQKSGQDLEFRSILQGSGISVTTSGSTVRIDNNLEDDVQQNITNISNLTTDFTNSSGIFQDGTDTANQVRTDFDNSSGIFIKTASNVGLGEGVFLQKTGQDLEFKNILQGSGISVTTSGNTIRIDNNLEDDVQQNVNDISDLRTDFDNSSGVFRSDIDTNTTNISNLQTDFDNSSGVFRNDIDNNTTNITNLTTDFTNSSGIFQDGADTANQIRTDFDNASGIWVKDGENLGIGSGLFVQKDAQNNLEFKSLVAGANVEITGNANELIIAATPSGAGSGEANTASNLGIGREIFKEKSGVDFRFRTIFPGSGIIATQDADHVSISTSGIIGENIGLGEGIFAQTNIDTLEFRSLLQGSGITITTSGNTIRIDSQLEDDVQQNVTSINTLRADFDNSSGVFRSDIDTNSTNITNLQTDFTNSSGVFRSDIDQNTTNISNLQTDFDNSSGVFRNDIDQNSTDITNLTTDFTNSSGVFQNGADTAAGVRTDFDNVSGVFRTDIDTNTTNISNLQTDFTNSSGIFIKTASNQGTGSGIFLQKTGQDLEFKTIVPGSGITIIGSGSELTINSTAAGGGEANTASNVGLGEGIFSTKNGVDLEFRSLLQGSGIQIATSGDTIRIDSRLEDDVSINTTNITNLTTDFTNSSGVFQDGTDTANQVRTDFDNSSGIFIKTASNQGLGVGSFLQKTGQDLEFRSLLQGSGIQITASGSTIRIDNNLEDDVQINTSDISNLRTDFDNSSGIFRSDIDTNTSNISSLQTDFTNSSGIFQTGTDTANQVRTDFDNSSGVFRSDIDTNTTNISNLQTDFTNSSGIFQGGVDTADQVRTDFDNVSGVFRSDIDQNTTDVSTIRTDFDNASGIWVKDGTNLGDGSGLFVQKNSNNELEFKSILAGSNIVFTGTSSGITISSTASGAGGGEANTASNIGFGEGVFSSKDGVDLEFRSLLGSSGIIVSTSGDTIRLDNILVDDFSLLRTDFDNASGLFYKKDEDLIPITGDTFDLGSTTTRFKESHVSSGQFEQLQTNIYSTPISGLTSAASIAVDLTQRNEFRLVLGTDVTFTLNNPVDGAKYTFILKQDSTGSRDASWPTNIEWRGGGAPDLTPSGNAVDVVTMVYDTVDDVYYADFGRMSVFGAISPSGEANDGSNLGTGSGIFAGKVGQILTFKTFIAGSGLIITGNDNEITLTTTGSVGEANDAVNVGLGQGIFAEKQGLNLEFRSLLQGSGIQIAASGDTIRIDSKLEDDVSINTSNITNIRTDFDNSSGVFRSDIDTNATNISNLTTDFTNSSGIFQNGVDAADQVRIDFDNSSGVFVNDISQNSTDISNLTTDFTNSSGIFQDGVDTANQVRTDFDNSSGVFRNDIDTNSTNITNLQTDFTNASGIWVKDGDNLGDGSGIFVQKNSQQSLEFKSLLPGDNITIIGTSSGLTINSTASGGGGGQANTASNVGLGQGIFAEKVDVDLEFRSLLQGSGIQISASGDTIRIDSQLEDDVSINVTNITNLTTDFTNSSGIFQGGVDTANNVRTDFDNVSGVFRSDIDQNTTDISNLSTDFTNSSGVFRSDIDTNTTNITNLQTDFDNASGIWVKDGENLGSASGIFVQKDTDNNLEFKSLAAGGGIQITGTATELTIASIASGAGEANDGENIGLGEGVFNDKSGVNLRFKSLFPGSGIKITASGDSLVFDNDISDDFGILQTNFNNLQTDFDNSSGVFRSDIDSNTTSISNLQTDFTNSSGVFQTGTDTANQVRTDFDNVSGVFRTDIDSNTSNITSIQTDFTNSSGVFRNDIDTNTTNITSIQTDFTNSSGVFQAGTDTADQVRIDFDNSSGIFVKTASNVGLGESVFEEKAVQDLEFRRLLGSSGIIVTTSGSTIRIDNTLEDDVQQNITNITNLQTDFTNSSGVFQDGVDTANQVRTDFDNSSGVFRADIDTNTTNITNLQTDFTNSSGVFRNDIDQNTTNITNLTTDFTNSSGVFQGGVDTANSVQTDFTNASGNFYREDEDLIPIAPDTHDIGSAATRFNDVYAGSGNFVDGLGNDAQWNISPSGRTVFRTSSSPFVTLTAAATTSVDFTIGYNFRISLTTDVTFVFANPADGERYLFHVKQDATGGRTLSWPSNVLWPSGNAPIITSSGLARDVVTLFYDVTDDVYLGGFGQSFF